MEMARKTWEMENNIVVLPPSDEIFRYDAEQQQRILTARPWEKDPNFLRT